MMPQDELIEIWATPRRSTTTRDAFDIRHQVGRCYAAVSPTDTAALIIPLPSGELPRGRVLGSVRLRFDRELRFEVEGESWTRAAAVVDCLDGALVRTFCTVVRDVLEHLQTEELTARRVLDALARWDELLRRRSPLTATSELGLWGELALISRCSSPDAMVMTWRGPHGDVVDFLGGGVALECKASPNRLRHRVSQRQAAFEGENVDGYLVSVWACEDPNGQTLTDLVDALVEAVVDEDAFRRKLLTAGYQDEHRHEYGRRFHCPANPKFFRLQDVPRVREADEGVSNVRYDIDLTDVSDLGEAEAARILTRLTKRTTP